MPDLSQSERKSHLPRLRVFRDRAQRLHYTLAPTADDAVAGWCHATRWLLAGALSPSTPEFLLGAMMLCDGVVAEAHLRNAWDSLSDVYVDGNGAACIEWLDSEQRQQRRQLSSVTLLSRVQQSRMVPFHVALAALLEVWPQTVGDLSELLEPLQAAMVLMVSGDLSGHVIGREQLTAVNRGCLVRLATRAALSTPHSRLAAEQASDSASLRLLDALHAASDRRGVHYALMERLVDAVRPDPQVLPGAVQQRASALARLRALTPAVEADGAWSAFLLIFVLQLARAGTRHTSPLAPRTIEEYVSLSVVRLANRLREIPIEDAPHIDWQKVIHEPILDDPTVPSSQLGKLAAALAAAHDVATSVLGAPPLRARLSPELPAAQVTANVEWDHEIAIASAWLAAAPEEDRLAAQARAMLSMLASAACRFEDTRHVHMGGVRTDGTAFRITIDPLASAGKGKSHAARRTIDISDAQHVHILEAWIERRREEGAMPRDLVFGCPEDGRSAYRSGASMGLLNIVLKAASGDPDVGTHTLRHSFLSQLRAGMSTLDQQRLDDMSAAAGHEWTGTTLKIYCNLYERLLRAQLDCRLHELPLTERAACRLLDVRPGRLRKQSQRSGTGMAVICWSALNAAARTLPLPPVSAGFETCIPVNPLAAVPQPLTFTAVFSALTDIASHRTPAAIALRHGLEIAQIEAVLKAVQDWHPSRHNEYRKVRPALPWSSGWPRARQVKWLAIRRALEAVEPALLKPVVDSWASVSVPTHINLEDIHSAIPLLHWLAKTGLNGEQILVQHEASVDARPALELIEDVFGQPAIVQTVGSRRGRCKVYLSVLSAPRTCPAFPPPNAAASIVGLQVLLFTAWVWVRLVGDRHG